MTQPKPQQNTTAPIYQIPRRDVIAIEHPMIVQNLDNAVKSFGKARPFQRIIESRNGEDIIPLYLRPNDAMNTPILSQNSATNNLLLKITVPKRIAKKRKRGSQDPYDVQHEWMPIEDDNNIYDDDTTDILQSHSRLDKPARILRKLRDNKDNYTVEVAGEVSQTHRYRGIADFTHSTSNSKFYSRLRDTAMKGTVDEMRKFKLGPQIGFRENEEFIPAPMMTTHSVPFNWGWHQNPNISLIIDKDGNKTLINRQVNRKVLLEYPPKDVVTVPQGPLQEPPADDENLLQLVKDLKDALEERPVWTRRALMNRVGESPHLVLFKEAIQYVGYQLKGGPFRDAVIKFGVDPRSDPKYRKYQVLFFKIYAETESTEGMQWRDKRTSYVIQKKGVIKEDRESHIFDGQQLVLDGKIWQVCDVTDPLLEKLMREAPYRETFDIESDGWFYNGTMAKIRAIMKAKLIAIRVQRELKDEEFSDALRFPDNVPGKNSKSLPVPIKDARLTVEEYESFKKQGLEKVVLSSGIKQNTEGKSRTKRIRKQLKDEKPFVSKKRRRKIPLMGEETSQEQAMSDMGQMQNVGQLSVGQFPNPGQFPDLSQFPDLGRFADPNQFQNPGLPDGNQFQHPGQFPQLGNFPVHGPVLPWTHPTDASLMYGPPNQPYHYQNNMPNPFDFQNNMADTPMTSVEHSPPRHMNTINEEAENSDPGSDYSDDEETDIEGDEISDGAEDVDEGDAGGDMPVTQAQMQGQARNQRAESGAGREGSGGGDHDSDATDVVDYRDYLHK